jgi:hypothetical protein
MRHQWNDQPLIKSKPMKTVRRRLVRRRCPIIKPSIESGYLFGEYKR